MVKLAATSGIRSAMANPASVSCCLMVLMTTARFTCTAPLLIVTASPPLPVSAATSSEWAVRFASIQACSNASDCTKARIRSETKLRIPEARGPETACRVAATLGGTPRSLSACVSSIHGCVEVEVGEDHLLSARRDRLLHVRVVRERPHGGDVPVGVLDLAAGPGREHGQRGEQRSHGHQEAGQDRAPPSSSSAVGLGQLLAKSCELRLQAHHLGLGGGAGVRACGSGIGHPPTVRQPGATDVTRCG